MSKSDISVEKITDLIRNDLPPDPVWIGPALLPKGGKLLFGGEAKIGKSFILLSLARALALGERPFNCPHFDVPKKAKCLIIEQELGEYRLKDRVKPMYTEGELSLIEDKIWYVSKEPEANFSTHEGRDFLRGLIQKVEPNVILCDPMGKMHTYDENSNTEIARLFHNMDVLIKEGEDLGLSFIVSHHFGKPNRDPNRDTDPLDPYNFRGASKWYDDPDALGTVRRLQDYQGRRDAWYLRMRWESRGGETPPDGMFIVNKDHDWRVTFEKDVAGKAPRIMAVPLTPAPQAPSSPEPQKESEPRVPASSDKGSGNILMFPGTSVPLSPTYGTEDPTLVS